jgi:hypothetical protein
MQLERHHQAEQIRAQQQPPWPPACEHHKRQRDPAAAGGELLGPHGRQHQRVETAGNARHGAAEQHGHIAHGDDRIADRVGRAVRFAHRPQDQPGTGGAQEPAHHKHHDDREIHDRAVAENHPPERVLCQCGRKHRTEHIHGLAYIACPSKCRQADAENGQGEPGGHLVCRQRECQKAEDESRSCCCQHGGKYANDRLTGHGGDGKAGDGAHQHHAFDAEVQHPRFLHYQLAKCRQQDWRCSTHDGHDDRDQHGRRHGVPPAPARPAMRTR